MTDRSDVEWPRTALESRPRRTDEELPYKTLKPCDWCGRSTHGQYAERRGNRAIICTACGNALVDKVP